MACGFGPFTDLEFSPRSDRFQNTSSFITSIGQIVTQIQKAVLPFSCGIGRWGAAARTLGFRWVSSSLPSCLIREHESPNLRGRKHWLYSTEDQPRLEVLACLGVAKGGCQHSFSSPGMFSLFCLFLQIFLCAPNLSLPTIICPWMMEMHSHIRKTRNNFLTNMRTKTTLLSLPPGSSRSPGLPSCLLFFIMEHFKHIQRESG